MKWARIQKPGPTAVLRMAWKAQVHPDIIAGRVRYELYNCRLLSRSSVQEKVLPQFEEGT